jgi:hypothetical protein
LICFGHAPNSCCPDTTGAVLSHYWPLVIDLVARQIEPMSKTALDLKIGVSLLMECAIAMSKVDPKTVPQVMPTSAKA